MTKMQVELLRRMKLAAERVRASADRNGRVKLTLVDEVASSNQVQTAQLLAAMGCTVDWEQGELLEVIS